MARRGGPRHDVHARVRARRPARRQHAGWSLHAARVPRSGASARACDAVVRRGARDLASPVLLTLLWAAVAAAAWRAARVLAVSTRGAAQLTASALGAAGLLVVAISAPVAARATRHRRCPSSPVSRPTCSIGMTSARGPSPSSTRRFRIVTPEAALSDVVFAAEPGFARAAADPRDVQHAPLAARGPLPHRRDAGARRDALRRSRGAGRPARTAASGVAASPTRRRRSLRSTSTPALSASSPRPMSRRASRVSTSRRSRSSTRGGVRRGRR